jgi:hypothetical protein
MEAVLTYSGLCLEEMKKVTRALNQDSAPPEIRTVHLLNTS